MFTIAAFASVNKEKSVNTKINKKAVKSKVVKCYAYQQKIEQNVNCSVPSYFTVTHVDTISVTCDANGVAHVQIWSWDQDPSLLCQPMRKTQI